jgi:hypothetical protein
VSSARGLPGALLAGGLLGALLTVVAGYAIDGVGMLTGSATAGHAYRTWLSGGGWVWPSVYGVALASWVSARRMEPGRGRWLALVLAVVLALLPLVWHPFVPEGVEAPLPATAEGRIRVIRSSSYRSPATVARLLPLSRDSDPVVRGRAALALGTNLIVTDIERDRPAFPSRHGGNPLRDSLRVRLLELLDDPNETVRAEAARSLWNGPRTFGPQPAAAETLSAMLDRRALRGDAGREAWLALDAAAGGRDPGLTAAARRFAASSPDTALARVARDAASRPSEGPAPGS